MKIKLLLLFLGLVSGADIINWLLMSPTGALPQARAFQAAWYISGSIIIFGGTNLTASGICMSDMWNFTVATNQWSQMTPSKLPSCRFDMGNVYVPTTNSLLIYGGTSGFANLADWWIYSLINGNWTNVNSPSNPSARGGFSMTLGSNTLLFFGGWNAAQGFLSDLWTSSASQYNWVPVAPLAYPVARAYHGAVFINSFNYLLVYGGFNNQGFLNDTWIYWSGNNTWVALTLSGSSAIPARSSYSLFYLLATNMTYIFGGNNGGTALNDFWNCSVSSFTCSQLTGNNSYGPTYRYGHSAIGSSSTMYIFGGAGTNFNYTLNDLWNYTLNQLTREPTPQPYVDYQYVKYICLVIAFQLAIIVVCLIRDRS